ncbi:MAG: hypothetical protein WC458_03090 [Patescibacteria group bacterium]|jgi:hypothetical protein
MMLNVKFDSSLARTIIKTIVFFDLFEYPLTAYEIYKYSNRAAALGDILEELMTLDVATKNGFYFLRGREEIVATRQKRHNYACRKIKIAQRFARLFGFCPFVKMVALANSLGQHNLRDESDIDFFIITAPRRIWLSRLYCAGWAKILNRRPTATDKKDKICLSFYISEDRLNLDDLRLTGADPYFDHWRGNLVLLYNKEEMFNRFLRANDLPDIRPAAPMSGLTPADRRPGILDSFNNRLEGIAKKLQLKIMSPALKAAMNNSDGVVINDRVLKLYRRDRRREYAEKYGQKINEIFADGA